MATQALGVIGLGPIGRSWLRAFSRSGFETRIWDPDPAETEAAWTWLKADLKLARKRQGLRKAVTRSQKELVTRCETLEEAVAGTMYVQESGTETLAAKRKLFAQMHEAGGARTLFATSSSRVDPGRLTADLPGRGRTIIAHPVHLPHVVPGVEVCPGPDTEASTVRRTMRFLSRVGQVPIPVKRFVPGLVSDRLRAALIRESLHLVASGAAEVPAVEETMRSGLGLLWAVMGPMTAGHTGSNGVRAEIQGEAESCQAVWKNLATDLDLTPELMDRLGKTLETKVRGIPWEDQLLWRDEMIERIRRLRLVHPLGATED